MAFVRPASVHVHCSLAGARAIPEVYLLALNLQDLHTNWLALICDKMRTQTQMTAPYPTYRAKGNRWVNSLRLVELLGAQRQVQQLDLQENAEIWRIMHGNVIRYGIESFIKYMRHTHGSEGNTHSVLVLAIDVKARPDEANIPLVEGGLKSFNEEQYAVGIPFTLDAQASPLVLHGAFPVPAHSVMYVNTKVKIGMMQMQCMIGIGAMIWIWIGSGLQWRRD